MGQVVKFVENNSNGVAEITARLSYMVNVLGLVSNLLQEIAYLVGFLQ
jgi:hypothetical protein